MIDASIYIFKYYFSMPDVWQSESGYSTFAVRGYTTWLGKFLAKEQPIYAAACFDESLATCFRNEIYPDYKISRALPDDELAFQLEACKQITELMGIASYASERFEADDLIGTLAHRAAKKQLPATILTRDKDLGQLAIHADTLLWDYPDKAPLTHFDIAEKFGVQAKYIADFLALTGDVSDDIPGVPGIGPKIASMLIHAFGGWRNIRRNIPAVAQLNIRGAASIANKLTEFNAQIDMALKLTTIVKDASLGRRFHIKMRKPDIPALESYGQYLGLNLNFKKMFNEI